MPVDTPLNLYGRFNTTIYMNFCGERQEKSEVLRFTGSTKCNFTTLSSPSPKKQNPLLKWAEVIPFCWGAGIRTPITRSRAACPAVGRLPNVVATIFPPRAAAAASPSLCSIFQAVRRVLDRRYCPKRPVGWDE